MRRLPAPVLLALALLAVPAQADPLICADPGPTHVGPHTVDLPEVCLL